MNTPPNHTRPLKADLPLRVVKSTAIDAPEAISDRMIRIEAAQRILQHFASSDQFRERSGANAVSQLEPTIHAKSGLRLFDGSPGVGYHDVPKEKAEPVPSKCVAKNTGEKDHELMNRYTTFYKNKTSDFFGELQEAERLLYKKLHLISKIDFPAQKRRTLDREVTESGKPETLADVLSDSGEKCVVEQPKSRTKQAENKQPVVEMETFVESFSKMRTSEYRNHLKKESRKKTPYPYEKLFDEIHPKVEAKCNVMTTTRVRSVEPSQNGECQDVSPFPEYGVPEYGVIVVDEPPLLNTIETDISPVSSPENAIFRPASIVPEDTQSNDTTNIEVCAETVSKASESQKTVTVSVDVPDAGQEQPSPTKHHVSVAKMFAAHAKNNGMKTDAAENDSAAVEKCPQPEEEPSGTFSATDSSTIDPMVAPPVEKTNANEPEQADTVAQVTHSIAVEVNDMRKTDDAPAAPKVVFPTIVQRLEELAPEQYDSLAEHIKNKVYDGNRLIAFCGMKRHVGCSTMTLAAARGMARHGLKTIVVDANFEFPTLGTLQTSTPESDGAGGELHRRLKPSETSCWVDVLLGKADWESIGFSPDERYLLTILPLSENALTNWSHVEPEELQQKTNRLIANLHEHFDLVLLDCGSFDPEYEEITWGELELFQPDGVVLVRNPKTVPLEKMEPYRRDLRACGMEEFGVAENFV